MPKINSVYYDERGKRYGKFKRKRIKKFRTQQTPEKTKRKGRD